MKLLISDKRIIIPLLTDFLMIATLIISGFLIFPTFNALGIACLALGAFGLVLTVLIVTISIYLTRRR